MSIYLLESKGAHLKVVFFTQNSILITKEIPRAFRDVFIADVDIGMTI